jgi:putative transposase
LTTKIHAVVDALGNPVTFSLTPGQASDVGQAEPLLEKVSPKAFLADKAYDANALISALEERAIIPVIPAKSNRIAPRETDFALYRERNLIERFFNTIKNFRAIATRYDKLANSFLGAVHLVAIFICLK